MYTKLGLIAVTSFASLNGGCKRSAASPAPGAVAVALAPSAPSAASAATSPLELAYQDGLGDVASIKSALGALNPSYRCDRLNIAVRSLQREADERYQRMVADAESVCGFQAPLGWAETKLTAIEGMKQSAEPKEVQEHCGEVRTMFARIASKFRTAPRIKTAADRFKLVCRGGRD